MQDGMLEQLQRYYTLWKESKHIYDQWAKSQGLSANSLLILYSFYSDGEDRTQKAISQKWSIPKQTVNTILKKFEQQGYIELLSVPTDKRNKQIRLTPAGQTFTNTIIERLYAKELHVMQEMGLDHITSMNDDLALFIKLFREGGTEEHE